MSNIDKFGGATKLEQPLLISVRRDKSISPRASVIGFFFVIAWTTGNVTASDEGVRYGQVGFEKFSKPHLAHPIQKRGKSVLLDGSEIRERDLDSFGQLRRDFVKTQLRFGPGGMDAGGVGDMACFFLERRYSQVNPGGAITFYIRVPQEVGRVPLPMVTKVSHKDIFAQTLLSGDQGVALVVINRNYKMPPIQKALTKHDGEVVTRFRAARNVNIRVTLTERIKPGSAKVLNDGKMSDVKMSRDGPETVIELDDLEVACLVWIDNGSN